MPTARKMPANIDAEMNILGIAFLDNSLVNQMMDELYPEVFYSDKNQKLFSAIKACYDNKVPIDITTIKEELTKKNQLEAVGVDYITEVIDSVVTSANLDHYIKMIKDKAVARELINTATNIITTAYDEDLDITSVLDNAENKIINVAKARETTDFIDIKDALSSTRESLDELAKAYKAGNKLTGITSGYKDLDQITFGFHPGELIIIGARPGMGKTAFALNIATNAAKSTPKAVAIFNLEMTVDSLVTRMISSVGQVEGSRLQTGYLEETDWQGINEASAILSKTNIQIVADSGVNLGDIKAKCRNIANRPEGLGLVIIDYLQLVTMGGRRPDNRQQEVQEISRSLKQMALELKVPVIACAQLSRGVEQRDKTVHRPMLSDLRESGAIEQDADLVMFIDRKDYYQAAQANEKPKNVVTDIIIAKNRKGTANGTVQLLFKLPYSLLLPYLAPREEEGEQNG